MYGQLYFWTIYLLPEGTCLTLRELCQHKGNYFRREKKKCFDKQI